MKLRRLLTLLIALLPFLPVGQLLAQPQVGYVTVYGTRVGDSTGTPEANGTIYFAPVSSAGQPLSYRIGQGYGANIATGISGGAINACNVINGGLAYTGTVSLQLIGGGGTGGAVHATISGTGVINGCVIDSSGSGYTTPPNVLISGYGQSVQTPVQAAVTNGAYTITVADTAMTSPVNICYSVTVIDNVSGNSILGPGYSCVQPASSGVAVTGTQAWCASGGATAGGSCDFDAYTPNLSPLLTSQAWPTAALGIGTVSTLAPGSPATASISGTAPNQSLSLGIPTGATGATGPVGPAPTIANVSVSEGSTLGGTWTGCPSACQLNLVITAGMNYRGLFTASTAYNPGDIVLNAGSLYVAPAAFTSGASFNATNWNAYPSSGGSAPGGSVGTIQYNAGGALNGDSNTSTDGAGNETARSYSASGGTGHGLELLPTTTHTAITGASLIDGDPTYGAVLSENGSSIFSPLVAGYPDEDLYTDATGQIENGGLLTANNGLVCRGDSNAAAYGLSYLGQGWCGQLATMLNISNFTGSLSGSFGTATEVEAGDTVGDFADWAILEDTPNDTGNPVVFSGYSTNNYKYWPNSGPPTATQIASFKSQYEAGMAWEATSNATDKYFPATGTATATSYQIVGGPNSPNTNTAVVTANNSFYAYQRVVLSGFTTSPMSGLNNTVVQILPSNLGPTQYTFSTGLAVTASTSDTGTATIPNKFTASSGTWSSVSPLVSFGFTTPVITAQGVGYSVGNVLSFPCSGSPMTATVNALGGTPFGTGLTINITASGGVITAGTIASGGSSYSITSILVQVTGGGGSLGIFQVNTISGGVVTGISLVSGGSGYTTTSAAATSLAGELTNGSLKIASLGSGCTYSGAVQPSCSVGTASSCGYGGSYSLSVGPQMIATTTGGTLVSPTVASGNAIAVSQSGDVEVIYPSGPDYGGTAQFLIDGTAAVDSIFGSSTINLNYTGGLGPANFPTGDTFQLAHFKTTSGYHQFSWVCAAGNTCGIMAVLVPGMHNAGIDSPNITAAGAIPEQFNLGSTTSTCGFSLPQGCWTLASQYIQQAVTDLASAGERVKYADNTNIDGTLDFVNNGNGMEGTGALILQRIPNGTNALHMAVSGHSKFARNMLWNSKVVPATPPNLTLSTLIAQGSHSSMAAWSTLTAASAGTATSYMGPGLLIGEQPSYGQYEGFYVNTPGSAASYGVGATTQELMSLVPSTSGFKTCNYVYNSSNGYTPGVINILGPNAPSQTNCQFEWSGNSMHILAQAAATSSVSSPSQIMEWDPQGWNGSSSQGGRFNLQALWNGSGSAAQMYLQFKCTSSPSTGTMYWSFVNSSNGGRNDLCDGSYVTTTSQAALTGSRNLYYPNSSGTIATDIAFSASPNGGAPVGTPTFTAGTNVTSVVCATSYTCTNKHGRLTIVGGTATTGTIATVAFSSALQAVPWVTVLQPGAATAYGIDHSVPTANSFYVTAAASVSGATLTVEYDVTP